MPILAFKLFRNFMICTYFAGSDNEGMPIYITRITCEDKDDPLHDRLWFYYDFYKAQEGHKEVVEELELRFLFT